MGIHHSQLQFLPDIKFKYKYKDRDRDDEEIKLGISLFQKKNKSWNFAQFFWGLLEVGMESPKNDFLIYRPINDTRQAVSSLGGDIGGGMSKNRFRTITFDWSVLWT